MGGVTHLKAHYYPPATSVSHQRSLAHPRLPIHSRVQQHHSSEIDGPCDQLRVSNHDGHFCKSFWSIHSAHCLNASSWAKLMLLGHRGGGLKS